MVVVEGGKCPTLCKTKAKLSRWNCPGVMCLGNRSVGECPDLRKFYFYICIFERDTMRRFFIIFMKAF